jgi:hypothetical protein
VKDYNFFRAVVIRRLSTSNTVAFPVSLTALLFVSHSGTAIITRTGPRAAAQRTFPLRWLLVEKTSKILMQ